MQHRSATGTCHVLVCCVHVCRPLVAEQCGNAAYGICQNRATDAKVSPCGGSFNGVNQCNKDEFQRFYNGGCTGSISNTVSVCPVAGTLTCAYACSGSASR